MDVSFREEIRFSTGICHGTFEMRKFYDRHKYLIGRTRQIIRYRATDSLGRRQIKQYTTSNKGGGGGGRRYKRNGNII